MRTTRRKTSLLTALLAMASGTASLHAQPAQLAQLSFPVEHVPDRSTPISDDGDHLDALLPAAQLLITFNGSGQEPVSVQVFDESGRMMVQHTARGRSGRQLLPMDVKDLPAGRYLVRVQEGDAVSMSRFLRP